LVLLFIIFFTAIILIIVFSFTALPLVLGYYWPGLFGFIFITGPLGIYFVGGEPFYLAIKLVDFIFEKRKKDGNERLGIGERK
jgi:hypothetical protein